MDVDDELRSRLQREHLRSAGGTDARARLTTLGPALRRARRRRIATVTASAALGVAGLTATALAVRDITDDTTMIVEGTMPPDVAPTTEPDDLTPTTTSPSLPPPSTFDADDGDDTGNTPTSTPNTEPTTTGATDDESTPSSTPSGTGAGATTTTVTTTTVAPPAVEPPPTTAPPATTTTVDDDGEDEDGGAGTDVETYECDCGTVTVDQQTGELVVEPAAGYTYRLEDVDDDGGLRSRTVQFTGGGEDCELVVPLP